MVIANCVCACVCIVCACVHAFFCMLHGPFLGICKEGVCVCEGGGGGESHLNLKILRMCLVLLTTTLPL